MRRRRQQPSGEAIAQWKRMQQRQARNEAIGTTLFFLILAAVIAMVMLGGPSTSGPAGHHETVRAGEGGGAGGSGDIEVWTVWGVDDLWNDMTQEEKDMCIANRDAIPNMVTPQRERCAAYMAGYDEGIR